MMRRLIPSPLASTSMPSRNPVPFVVAAIVVFSAIAAVGAVVWSPWADESEAQPGDGALARLWPQFEMTFSIRDVDPSTGTVIADQTWRLRADSERSWRADVVRDALDPANIGSYREFRDGVHTQYFAATDHVSTYRVETPDEVVALSEELDPTLYPWITNPNGDRHAAERWQVDQIEPNVVLTRSSATTPCGGDTCAETTRIWWDTTSERTGFLSPLPARAERTVDGTIVHSFVVESLTVASSGSTGP